MLALAAWFLAREVYTGAVVALGSRVLALLAGGMEAAEIVTRDGDRFVLDTGIARPDGSSVTTPLKDVHAVTWNAFYFWWLLLMTPLRVWRRSWPFLLAGHILLLASQVGFFVLNATVYVAQVYDAHGVPFLGASWISVLDTSSRAYSLTLSHLLPFLLYGPVLLRARRAPRAARPRTGSAPGRNAPCPCGSGRKYKRCCGGRA